MNAFVLGTVLAAISPLSQVDDELVERLCNAEGGLAGHFGVVPDTSAAEPVGIDGAPRWTAGPPLEPFDQYEVWQTPRTGRIHTLRYMAPTSEELDRETLTLRIAGVAAQLGWKRIAPADDADMFERHTMLNSWHKQFERDGKTRLVTLMPDGGLTTVSLYCIDQTLRNEGESERSDQIEERLEMATDAKD